MNRYRRREINRFFIMIIILMIFVISVIKFIEIRIRPPLHAISEAKARMIATQAINESINIQLMKSVEYNELMNIISDNDGSIVMLQADTMKINQLASNISLEVHKNLSEIAGSKIRIPLGTVLKSNLFANIGPRFNIKISPIGSVETDFYSDFEQAGINQTRHMIYLRVKTYIQVVIPMSTDKIEVISHALITESIIVGKVPDFYVNVDDTDRMMDIIPRRQLNMETD